ncbi:unnamed protein product [Leptidea sinapis]|uniref:Uncharacterized protein n=1 Tax=Leptidea sinapis TaxID=189913 RepID=A0A5E4R0U6_9NEOP|nr:unnamed protein product [Leptidea sinapis]
MDKNIAVLEDDCEHLMNVVVDTRKAFGKKCVDYDSKRVQIENKILKLQLKSISLCKIKSKKQVPKLPLNEMMKDIDNFKEEILLKEQRLKDVCYRSTNLKNVVVQLKSDNFGRRLKVPLTAEDLLREAKIKNQ